MRWTARAATLNDLSPGGVAFLGLLLICLLQTSGIYVFVKGFLLSRVALADFTPITGSNTIKPYYGRAVILIVDALRYDFIFPSSTSETNFENILKFPAQLSQETPENSQLFKFIADPPTTTLQRLKALTVGTLPTFVDAGSNFAGSSITEDNWLAQAQRAGKRVAFTGDDTWISLFPPQDFQLNVSGALDTAMCWPYDSFNVEDLDTVDNGVRTHLYPLLEGKDENSGNWDIAIGHMLGVDHVGHRVGPYHPEMRRKLTELDEMLKRIVANLRKDDLLIVMGDHGMDSDGNHGGDAPDEVSAGLWLFSKSGIIRLKNAQDTLEDLARTTPSMFWEDTFGKHRQISQISLVPTLSLLLGLPIPYSNLGSVIPELFTEKDLKTVSNLNVEQVNTFLRAYLKNDAGSDLKLAQRALELEAIYSAATSPTASLQTKFAYLNLVLEATRASWATFDATLMSTGLAMLIASVFVLISFARASLADGVLFRQGFLRLRIGKAYVGLLCGCAVGLMLSPLLDVPRFAITAITANFGASVGYFSSFASVPVIETQFSWSSLGIGLIPIIHGLSFASNSFVLWEDRMVVYLFQALVLFQLARAFTSPQARLRNRIAMFSGASLVLVRLASLSTICREEQQPNCRATFHLHNTMSFNAITVLALVFSAAVIFPTILAKVLDQTQSRQGISSAFLAIGLRGCLLGSAIYSITDFIFGAMPMSSSESSALVLLKNTTAITVFVNIIVGVGLIWHFLSDFNVDIRQTKTGDGRTQIELVGFANSLGSTYLLPLAGVYAFLMILNRPIGQLTLSAGMLTVIALLEANDSRKDAETAKTQLTETAAGRTPSARTLRAPSFSEVIPAALLGFILFFATGHQAVLSSIQWKTAFVGFSTVVYPFSPILVVLNTLGPFILTAAAVPLVALWNVSPSIKNSPSLPLIRHIFRACVLFVLYHSLVAVPTAIFAAWHRRHLMVWKVFAPRFMVSAVSLLAVDGTICFLAFGWLSLTTLRKASNLLGSHWS